MDWVGILRELRMLATGIQTDRFYALYTLIAFILIMDLMTQLAQGG
jgi:hypothetical protein